LIKEIKSEPSPAHESRLPSQEVLPVEESKLPVINQVTTLEEIK
jgi:hypothetical protein